MALARSRATCSRTSPRGTVTSRAISDAGDLEPVWPYVYRLQSVNATTPKPKLRYTAGDTLIHIKSSYHTGYNVQSVTLVVAWGGYARKQLVFSGILQVGHRSGMITPGGLQVTASSLSATPPAP